MKVGFIIASIEISGGINVVFEYASRLKQDHHLEVFILHEKPVSYENVSWHSKAKSLSFLTYTQADLIEFDLLLATWWRTVFDLHLFKAKVYAHFCQSIESKFYPEEQVPLRKLVNSSYQLKLPVITEAKWIKNYLKLSFDTNAHLVRNGIRKDIYFPEVVPVSPRRQGRLRVLVEGPLKVAFKNVEKSIHLCRKSLADEIWLLTSSQVDSVQGVDRVFSCVPVIQTSAIYASCDVIVKLSYIEGMFGPPLEMFHCGGTAITYNVTGHDEYLVHNENSIVVPTDDESSVINAINQIKKDTKLLHRLLNGASLTAETWPDWQKSCSDLYRSLINIIENHSKPIKAEEIKEHGDKAWATYAIEEKQRLGQIGFHARGYFSRITSFSKYLLNTFPRFSTFLKKKMNSSNLL